MANSLQQPSYLDSYDQLRRQVENQTKADVIHQSDIAAGRVPAPPIPPVNTDTPTLGIVDSQSKSSDVYKSEVLDQTAKYSKEKEGGFWGAVSFVTSPLMAIGDAAIAPIANPADSGDFLRDVATNFKTSGKAFMDALLPEFGEARPEYGKDAAKQLGIDEKYGTALEIMTDPSMVLGLGSAKLFQKGLRSTVEQGAKQGSIGVKTGIEQSGPWKNAVEEVLGVVKPTDVGDSAKVQERNKLRPERAKQIAAEQKIIDEKTSKFAKLVERADSGDKEATKELIENLDKMPGAAKTASKIENNDIAELYKTYEDKLGSIEGPAITPHKSRKVTPKQKIESLYAPTNTLPGFYNMARTAELPDITRNQFGKDYDKMMADFPHIPKDQNAQLRDLSMVQRDPMPEREAYILKQQIKSSSDNVVAMAYRASGPGSTPLDELNFDRAMAYSELIGAPNDITKLSKQRLVRALSTESKTPQGRLSDINKTLDTFYYRDNLHARAIKKKHLSSPAMRKNDYAASRYLSKTRKNKTGNAMFEIYTNSILSGPVTHLVNLGSNMLLTTWSPTETYLQSMSAAARGDFQKASVNLREANAKAIGIVQGLSDAFRIQFRDAPMEDMGYPDLINKRHELSKQQIHPSITSAELGTTGMLGTATDYLGKFVRVPGNMLMAEDKFMKIVNYRVDINAAAVRRSSAISKDPKVQRELYNHLRINPDENAIAKAQNMADYYTFTNELGKRGQSIAKGMRAIPGLRYLIPFFNTPTNIVKMGIRNSLVGNVFRDLPDIHKLTAKGDIARAKVVMGSVIPMTIIANIDPETVSGAVDMKSPEGQFKASMGIPPYSIRIGEDWYSYEKVEPMRSILGFYANFKEAYNATPDIDPMTGQTTDSFDNMVSLSIAPAIQTVGESYMLNATSGIINMLQGLQSGNPDFAWKTFQRTASSMVPYGSAINQFNHAKVDNVYRQADGFLDFVKQKIPGFSQTLPAGKTIWGDDKLYPDTLGPSIISPITTKKVSHDDVDKEIIRLQVSIPKQPKTIHVEGIELELDPSQREQFGVLRGKGFNENMPTLKESITQIMTHPAFITLSDIDKRAILDNHFSSMTKATKDYLFSIDTSLRAQFDERLQMREIERRRTQTR